MPSILSRLLPRIRWHASWVWIAYAACAHADNGIYGYTDDADVLHISNIPGRPGYRLIYSEPEPAPSRRHSSPRKRLDGGPTGQLPYSSEVAHIAKSTGMDPKLLHAVIAVESAYDHRALSRKGAMGLMQLMPNTSKRFGVANPWIPSENIRGGALYLSALLRAFDQDISLALAAYNAGERAVMNYGRSIPPYPETREYVSKVLTRYKN